MKNLAKYIDHTLLKPTSTLKDIQKLCREAKEYGFASVCVHPHYVKFAAKELKGSSSQLCTVIGFPLGANLPAIKAAEAMKAVEEGATEVDMVMNMSAFKSQNYSLVEEDIRAVVESVGQKICVKVIL